MGVVPLQMPRDRAALLAHFSALDADALRQRFGQTIRPEGVAAYVDSAEAKAQPSYGIFNSDLDLVAVAQFAASKDGLEVGISVLSPYRRHGLATALLRRAVRYARSHRINALVVHSRAANTETLALARRFGMPIVVAGAEANGRLQLHRLQASKARKRRSARRRPRTARSP
jgi:GNAT superfamily N-acetyltransferase